MSKKGEFGNICRGIIKDKDRIFFFREKFVLYINKVLKIIFIYVNVFNWYKFICISNWFYMYCNYIFVFVFCIRDILFFCDFYL